MVLLDHTRSITLYWRWLWHWDCHVKNIKNNIKSIFGGMNPFMLAESFSAVHGGTRVLIYSQMSNGQKPCWLRMSSGVLQNIDGFFPSLKSQSRS